MEPKENIRQTNAAEAAAQAKKDFLAIDNVVVSLTYPHWPDPIELKCKILLDVEDKDARQKFWSKPDADTPAAEFEYYVDMISRVMVASPIGLPGFIAPDGGELQAAKDALRKYFATGEPKLQELASDLYGAYLEATQPTKKFR